MLFKLWFFIASTLLTKPSIQKFDLTKPQPALKQSNKKESREDTRSSTYSEIIKQILAYSTRSNTKEIMTLSKSRDVAITPNR